MKKDINKITSIEELEEYRKSVNEACDHRKEVLKIAEKAKSLSSESFGYLKESFESFSPSLFSTKEGRNLINQYLKTIKESKNLSTLHTLYENIRKANKNTDIDFFINNVVSSVNADKKALKEDMKKIGSILAESYIVVGDDADSKLPQKKDAFFNAVQFIAENKVSNKNLSEFSSAVKVVRNAIESNEANNIFESKSFDGKVKDMISNFNDKYSDALSDKEKEMVKELAESKDSKGVFDRYKNLCEEKIQKAKSNFDESGDSRSSEKMNAILEQVSKKEFSEETVFDDIKNLIEISEVFE
jgi:hypothetical protein